MPRTGLLVFLFLLVLPAAPVPGQPTNPGKPLPEIPKTGQATTNVSATNARPDFCLERFSLSGNLKKDNTGFYYNMSAGLTWQTGRNTLYNRVRLDNVEGYDTYSLLTKYNAISLMNETIHPYAILINEIYDDYPAPGGHTAGRIQWGGGFNFNLVETSRALFRLESGLDITHEFSTGLPDLVFWWRSRVRGEIEVIPDIRLGTAFILSKPFRTRLDHWYDYEFSLAYRLTKTVSIVGSVRFYDHRVYESQTDGILHQISFVYSM